MTMPATQAAVHTCLHQGHLCCSHPSNATQVLTPPSQRTPLRSPLIQSLLNHPFPRPAGSLPHLRRPSLAPLVPSPAPLAAKGSLCGGALRLAAPAAAAGPPQPPSASHASHAPASPLCAAAAVSVSSAPPALMPSRCVLVWVPAAALEGVAEPCCSSCASLPTWLARCRCCSRNACAAHQQHGACTTSVELVEHCFTNQCHCCSQGSACACPEPQHTPVHVQRSAHSYARGRAPPHPSPTSALSPPRPLPTQPCNPFCPHLQLFMQQRILAHKGKHLCILCFHQRFTAALVRTQLLTCRSGLGSCCG